MNAEDKKNLLDLLWKMYSENTTYARHHETQRSTVTNLILILAGVTMTLIGLDKSVNAEDLPTTIILIGLGLFGAIFSEQHFARARQHIERSKHYRAALDKLLPSLNDFDLAGIRGFVESEKKSFAESVKSKNENISIIRKTIRKILGKEDSNKNTINDDIYNDGVLTVIKRTAEMAYKRNPKFFLSSIEPGSFHIFWTGIHFIVMLIGIILTALAWW